MVTHYSKHGHPPSPGWSLISLGLVIHYQKYGHSPSQILSPNFQRMVTHHPKLKKYDKTLRNFNQIWSVTLRQPSLFLLYFILEGELFLFFSVCRSFSFPIVANLSSIWPMCTELTWAIPQGEGNVFLHEPIWWPVCWLSQNLTPIRMNILFTFRNEIHHMHCKN